MGEEKGRRASELAKMISEHKGEHALGDWESLQRVYHAYLVNKEELFELINLPNDNPEFGVSLVGMSTREEVMPVFFQELFRRLHNYLAIVTTLIDHTRNLTR